MISLERLAVISVNVFALGYYLGANSSTSIWLEAAASAFLYAWLFFRSPKVAVSERAARYYLRGLKEKYP